MSFVFRAFTKSRRRKKNPHPPAHPSNGSVFSISQFEECELTSSHDIQENQNKHTQQILVGSQTDGDDDDRTHPLLNEDSPPHCSKTSTEPSLSSEAPPNFSSPHDEKGFTHREGRKTVKSSTVTPVSNESTKRNLFKSLRRKPIPRHNTSQSTSSTTVESYYHTPLTASTTSPHTILTLSAQSSASNSDSQSSPPTIKRGVPNRFSEIYTPTKSTTRKLTFQDAYKSEQDDTSQCCSFSKAQSERFVLDSPVLSSGKKTSALKRGKRNKPLMLQNNFGSTTKTLIMNGDIVMCPSHTSNATISDTATTVSAASSKARALRREAERIARAAAALDNKGNELFERGHFDKAMACYSKALKLKRRTFAHLLEEADDMEAQLMMCEEKKADPQILVSMATSINNIGYLRQRNGEATPEETMAAYKKSLKIKRKILGNDSLSVGKTLNNIGSVHYLKREFDAALPAYEEALHIMKANLGEKHPDIATVMSNIGDVYLGEGSPERSLLKYRQALAIRWESFGEKDPRVIRLLEKIAKVEIGDRMLALSCRKDEAQTSWDHDEASEAMIERPKPISDELKNLQLQIAKDIQHVDLMERKATVEMLKDRIIIIRGMRAIWEGEGPELLDNDTASVKTIVRPDGYGPTKPVEF